MSLPPAGWYPDPERPDTEDLRWWNGTAWTVHEHRLPTTPEGGERPKRFAGFRSFTRKDSKVEPVANQAAPPRAKLDSTSQRGMPPVRLSAIIAFALFGVFALTSFVSTGLSGVIIAASLFAIGTALYTLVTSRPSWASIPSRKVAGVVTSVAALGLVAGAIIAPPQAIEKPNAQLQPVDAPAEAPRKLVESVPKDASTKKEPAADPLEIESVEVAGFKPSVVAKDSSVTAGTALATLETLQVRGRSAKTGYDRKAKFGSPWVDVDANGCDTRNDILLRDLTEITLEGACKVKSGELVDKYSGETIDFVRGNKTSPMVQIDHIVSLSDAWQKGGQRLTQHQRITLANDPLNLMAVGKTANSAKSDSDAASWLPSKKDFRCEFVARQIAVKATYGLWVTEAEKTAMVRVLNACPDQGVQASVFTPAPEPAPAPAPEPAPQPEPVPEPAPAPQSFAQPAPEPAAAPSNVYYKNCAAARAAGAAPVYEGQPGYGVHLDRDRDGVGCE